MKTINSAKRPTLQELIEIWKYSYARSSLNEAKEWIEIKQKTELPNNIRSSLLCSIVVAYARPFTNSQITKNQRVVPLKDMQPPYHLIETHKDALDKRDKVFGHKDATTSENNSNSPNIIIIEKDNRGFNLHTQQPVDISSKFSSELKELCIFFIQHCNEKLNLLISPYNEIIMQRQVGSYEIVITEPPYPWILPYT